MPKPSEFRHGLKLYLQCSSSNNTGGINNYKTKKWCYSLTFIFSRRTERWHSTSNTWLLCPWGTRQFWNWGKIADAPSLKASLSCLFAWQVSTLGCLNLPLMNSAVYFGCGLEVLQRGWRAGFNSGWWIPKFKVSDGLWHGRPNFTYWATQNLNTVEVSCCQSRWGLDTADYHFLH